MRAGYVLWRALVSLFVTYGCDASVLSQTLPFQQYKYAEGGREGGRRGKGLGKWPTLSRRAGISFYTKVRLKDKRISVRAKPQASIAQLGHGGIYSIAHAHCTRITLFIGHIYTPCTAVLSPGHPRHGSIPILATPNSHLLPPPFNFRVFRDHQTTTCLDLVYSLAPYIAQVTFI